MRKQFLQGVLAAAAFACGLSSAFAVDITGAGATFPYPIYAKWAEAYKAKTGVGMNYQSIGSGGGIAQIKTKTVDFGASDMPLKPEDLQTAGLMQFPAIIGGVVPVVNLEGVAPGATQLHRARCSPTSTSARSRHGMTRRSPISTRASSFPQTRSPSFADRMVPARRSLWTDYLSKVEPGMETEGRRQHGGRVAGRRRRQGQRRRCRLRAADQGFDRLRRVCVREEEQDDLRFGAESRRPISCSPTTRHFQAAAAGADWKSAPGYYHDPHRPARQDILADRRRELHPDAREAGEAAERGGGAEVLRLGVKNGQKMAEELDYVPLPAAAHRPDRGRLEGADQGRCRQAGL